MYELHVREFYKVMIEFKENVRGIVLLMLEKNSMN